MSMQHDLILKRWGNNIMNYKFGDMLKFIKKQFGKKSNQNGRGVFLSVEIIYSKSKEKFINRKGNILRCD